MRDRPYPQQVIDYREESQKVFNAGCDARLKGLSVEDNPYDKEGGNASMHAQWRSGWIDVHLNWGRLVRGRWRVPPLPQTPDDSFTR